MKCHGESSLDQEHGGGDTSPWGRNSCPSNPEKNNFAQDGSRQGFTVSASSGRSPKAVVVVESDDDGDAPTANLQPAPPNCLVCSKCTFKNRPSVTSGAPLPREPSACSFCLNPLQGVNPQWQDKDHPQSSTAVGRSLLSGQQPDTEEKHRLSTHNSGFTSIISSARSGSLPVENIREPWDGDALGDKCPVCTVFVSDSRATECGVCGASMVPASKDSSPGEASLRAQQECQACTLQNDPMAAVCSACDTPLIDGYSIAGSKGAATLTVEIPTSADLKERITAEGGDDHATTPGIIPRLQQRLLDDFGRKGDGCERERGEPVLRGDPATVARVAGRVRGGLKFYSTGVWKNIEGAMKSKGRARQSKGVAEWRLCDSKVMHYTQRESRGSEFSCGYRNIQMLCSALMEWPEYRRVLFGGSGCVPGISLLQSWIERAWAEGFDPEGCEQLGGHGALLGSETWIGATECATLLRFFGVKAEVIDFETATSMKARSNDQAAREGEQSKKRKAPDAPRSPSTHPKGKAHMDLAQQSIRSFLPSPSFFVREKNHSSRRNAITHSNSAPAGSRSSRSREAGGKKNAEEKIEQKHVCDSESSVRSDGMVCVDGASNDIDSWIRPRQPRLGGDSSGNGSVPRTATPSGDEIVRSGNGDVGPGVTNSNADRPSLPLSGGVGKTAGAGPSGPGRLSVRAVLGGKGGVVTTERGLKRTINTGKDGRSHMGRAIAKWAWEYFCAPWGTEESIGDADATNEFAALHPPPQGINATVAKLNTDRQPRSQDGCGSMAISKLSSETYLALPRHLSGDKGPTAMGRTRGLPAGGVSCGWDGGESGLPEDKARKISAALGHTLKRRPPPLYFQHDGHSRSVVGVLWPEGRENAKSARGANVGGDRGSLGMDRRGCVQQPGNLLVFDPSHSGTDILRALDDKQKKGWGRFLKRGERALCRGQFQMVAVRPGLAEKGQANLWKKIVSKKVLVE